MKFKTNEVEKEKEFVNSADNLPEVKKEKYKSLGIHFTKHEFDMLSKIALAENRSKLNTIKQLILTRANQI